MISVSESPLRQPKLSQFLFLAIGWPTVLVCPGLRESLRWVDHPRFGILLSIAWATRKCHWSFPFEVPDSLWAWAFALLSETSAPIPCQDQTFVLNPSLFHRGPEVLHEIISCAARTRSCYFLTWAIVWQLGFPCSKCRIGPSIPRHTTITCLQLHLRFLLLIAQMFRLPWWCTG